MFVKIFASSIATITIGNRSPITQRDNLVMWHLQVFEHTSIIRHSGASVLNVWSHHQSKEGQTDGQNCGGAAVQNGEQH